MRLRTASLSNVTAICLLAAAAVSLPAAAFPFECKPGRYDGKSWSVNEALHGKEVSVLVVGGSERCEFRFRGAKPGAGEIWELSGNKLVQRELDESGKEKISYGATLEVRGGVEGYYIDCKDEGPCDAGADRRSFWRIENKGNGIVYSFWGVSPEKAGDTKERARKRIEYRFSPSK